jgi:HD-GYP domain-containing protein (c-di-GMP phosphodiesterase class II)
MTAPAPRTPGPGSDPRSNADKVPAAPSESAIGLQAITRLSAAVRVGRAYTADNQVFGRQIEHLMEAIRPLLEHGGEAVLAAIDNDLYMNGTRIPVRGGNLRFHQHVLEELKRRQIAGFQARKGVTMEEMRAFFRVFMQPDFFTGPEMLQECIAQGAERMQPVVHASSAPTSGFSFGTAPLASDGEDGDGPPSDGTDGADFEGADSLPGGAGPQGPKGSVRKTYSAAVAGARSLLMTTSLQGGMELRHAKRVVQPLVDGAFSSEPVVVGLSSLSHHDQYTYAHAVNVTLVAVTMGHFLELDRRALADLGVAALLHDVGKSAVASRIEHLLESFTPEEERLAELHPIEGVKLLAKSTTLNATTLRCMRVALEHHTGPDQAGYPALGADWRTSMLSRIVSTADCFVSLQMHRSMRGAHVTPNEALGMMLGPLKPRFHPAMLWALVQTVGFYPPGQLVELEDGAIAVVLAPNAKDLARPHVRLVIGADGRRYAPGETEDLKPLPLGRSVKRALSGAEYPRNDAAAA